MRKLFLLFIVLFCLKVHAQDSLQVNPDRPDVTNGTSTVQSGYLQIEHGSFFQRQKADNETTDTYGFEDVSLRLGIVKKFELNFRYLLAQEHDDAFNTRHTGIATSSINFKYSIADQHGILPSFSLAGGVSLPFLTATAFGPQFTTYSAALLFQHELKGWEIGYNLIFNTARNTPDQFGYSISIRKDITEKFSAFVENYAFVQKGETDVSFDTGLGYQLNNFWMLDVAAATTVNRNTHYFTIGISYLIPKKLF